MSDKRRIAKNTVFLYLRMILVMGITIYTSRVVLEKLGIDNFGIYQTVGGVVGMVSFINGILSTGTSRFITFALGQNNESILRRTFSTTMTVQFAFIAVIIALAETVGLWFVKNKLEIPLESYNAAVWAYHIAILSTALGMLNIPFNATIIAHERMNFFAYTSIFTVSAQLGICYLLSFSPINKLVFYSLLIFAVTVIGLIINVIYCYKQFPESHYEPIFDKKIFKEIAGFSGWSIFAATSIALNTQGILILLNMFFSPAVVAARAISLQVNNAASQFVSNFRMAANPQIIKEYAAGQYDESKELLLSSTKFSFYLMFLISLPVCVGAYDLLHVWLKEVPPYSVIFLQIVIVQSLFQVFDTSFYTALYAKGDLKLNALISPTLGFIQFPIIYILFRNGASPVALSWAGLIVYAVLGLLIKPILLIKIVKYSWKDILEVIVPCMRVGLIASIVACTIISFIHIKDKDLLNLIIKTCICVAISIPTIYLFGLTSQMREKVSSIFARKFHL